MHDLLLNISSQLLTMGLPVIDNSLDKLLIAMQDFPKAAFFGNTLSMAKALGLVLALCVGSYEAWMMMLGRRGMDVMKLLRIVGISFCITWSGTICSALSSPGLALEKGARAMTTSKNQEVAMQEKMVAKLQKKYVDRLRAVQDSLNKAKEVKEIGEDAGTWDKVVYSMTHLTDVLERNAKNLAAVAETKISEWINDIIRFLGELIFQMAYYGMFVSQRCFMTIMGIFCPVAFALSIVPPWANAWSQWISKYLSLSLWGVVIYIILYYVDYILLYCLQTDVKAYTTLLGNVDASWGQIGTLGLQGIGSTCFYAMGMLVGSWMLKFVPEVSSWLIPGGVSSSIGSAMGGVATTAIIGTTQNVANTSISAATSSVTGTVNAASSVAGSYMQHRSDGHSVAGSIAGSVLNQTSIGKNYASGAKEAQNFNSIGK